MYDIVFQDKRLQELFLNFHSKKWHGLTIEEKRNILVEINNRVADLYGYVPNKLKIEKSSYYGYQSSFKGEIIISSSSLENDCGYEIIDTYFHELRHYFQSRAIENELNDNEYMDPILKEEIERNMLPGNYLSEGDFYKYQAMERDAWSTGMLFARRIYLLNREKISDIDEEWRKYCAKHKDVIVNFISDNDDSREKLEENKKILEDQYSSKISDKPQYELGKKYYRELKDKDFSEFTFKEVATLLSQYAFHNLEIGEKVKLLSRYRDLVKYKSLRYEIKENNVASIKVRKRIWPIDTSAASIMNDILSYNFQNMVDDIVSGKNEEYPLSNKAKMELTLNMYKDKNGKRINFVRDIDNLFVFSIQPYAKYESKYILSEFDKIKQIELEMYGKKHFNWEYWDNFYDNKMIFNTASEIMEKPFNEIYEELLDKYKANIIKDVHDRENVTKR